MTEENKEQQHEITGLFDRPEFQKAKELGFDFQAINQRLLDSVDKFVNEKDNENAPSELRNMLTFCLPVWARLCLIGQGNYLQGLIHAMCLPFPNNESIINWILSGKKTRDTTERAKIKTPMRAVSYEEIEEERKAAAARRNLRNQKLNFSEEALEQQKKKPNDGEDE